MATPMRIRFSPSAALKAKAFLRGVEKYEITPFASTFLEWSDKTLILHRSHSTSSWIGCMVFMRELARRFTVQKVAPGTPLWSKEAPKRNGTFSSPVAWLRAWEVSWEFRVLYDEEDAAIEPQIVRYFKERDDLTQS